MPPLLGAKLRYLRKQRQMTQIVFADLLGLGNQSSLSNLESGRRPPSLELVVKIAIKLEVSVDYLLQDNIPIEQNAPSRTVRQIAEAPAAYGYSTFGSRLQHLRRSMGETQASLAQALGLTSHTHISLLENDRKGPSIELLLRISEHFGTTSDELTRNITLISEE